MDVMTMRFMVIGLILLAAVVVIPFAAMLYWSKKYTDKGRWWMLPLVIIYLALFFIYSRELIPEKWSLKPVEVYHCEWKTNYVPKYPVEG